jgi:hypothetical protein
MQAVEPSSRDPPSDRVLVQPCGVKLTYMHDAVLAGGQRRDDPVRPVGATSLAVCATFVDHKTIVTHRV